jgi:UDP-GlcNAc:undecaprenyl-phosphate GlcNAc-1-phosphate transferase
MMPYLLAAGAATLASLLLVPPTVRLARARNLLDTPGAARRLHSEAVPRLGGIAVWLGCAAGIGLASLLGLSLGEMSVARSAGLFTGLLLMIVTGLVDDVRGLRAGTKFGAQCLAALLVIAVGFRIDAIALPAGAPISLGWLSVPLTLLWLVGVTNAFNIIDGLDGLASGVALIALGAFAVAAVLLDNAWTLLVMLPLAGGITGFLRYNASPARIFLGDVGSLSIGFALAVLGVEAARGAAGGVHMAVPVFALAFPLLDTAVAMLRRWLRGAPLMGADGRHVHHQLVGLGLTHTRTAVLIWLFALGVASLGLSIEFAPPAVTVALVAGGAALWVLLVVHGTRWLQYHEFTEVQASVSSGLLRARSVIRDRILARDLEAQIRRAESMAELELALQQSRSTFGFERVALRDLSVPELDTKRPARRTCECRMEYPLALDPATNRADFLLEIAWRAETRVPPLYVERVARMVVPALQAQLLLLAAELPDVAVSSALRHEVSVREAVPALANGRRRAAWAASGR